jgi:Xaa-Pro dipeptidase
VRDRLMSMLKANEFDAVIATTPENVQYVCGYRTGRQVRLNYDIKVYAIQTADQSSAPTLIVPTSHLGLVAQTRPVIDWLETYGTFFLKRGGAHLDDEVAARLDALVGQSEPRESAEHALLEALRGRDLLTGRIGVDEMGMSSYGFTELVGAFPQVSFFPAYQLFRSARAVKELDEWALMRRASGIAETAIESLMQATTQGDAHSDLVKEMNARILELGGVPELTNLRIGPSGAMPDVLPSDAVTVQPGSIVTWDVVIGVDGYHADTARSAVYGEPTSKQRLYYESLLAGQQSAVESVRPGVLARELFQKALVTVRQGGVLGYERNHVGHGIGLEVYEVPAVTADSTDVLEEGGIFNIETPYYELGFGCLMVEDTIRVTQDGSEYLTNADRGLRVLG